MTFEDGENLPGVTDDDLSETDNDAGPGDEAPAATDLGDEGEDLERLLVGTSEEEDKADEGDKGDESPAPAAKDAKTADPAAKPADQAKPEGEQQSADPPVDDRNKPIHSQADLERILAQRLGRDRKAEVVQEVESILGKPLEQFAVEARKAEIEKTQEQYSMTEEEATAFVTQRQELSALKAQQAELEQRTQELQAITAYQQEKAKHQSNPLAQKYAADVDNFTQYGKLVSYEDGLAYILGQKVLKGEITEAAARGAEQKVLANVQKRGQAAPETGGAAGVAKPTVTMTRAESVMAKNLGLSDKEWLASRAKLQRRK